MQKPRHVPGGQTEFRIFSRDIHLEEDVHGNSSSIGLFVQFPRQRQTVKRVYILKFANNILDLIGLQMSDEMPRSFMSQGIPFGLSILPAAFGNIPKPCLQHSGYRFQ
ncbi:hypothetical protein D3C75_948980 [compost metagenome]